MELLGLQKKVSRLLKGRGGGSFPRQMDCDPPISPLFAIPPECCQPGPSGRYWGLLCQHPRPAGEGLPRFLRLPGRHSQVNCGHPQEPTECWFPLRKLYLHGKKTDTSDGLSRVVEDQCDLRPHGETEEVH